MKSKTIPLLFLPLMTFSQLSPKVDSIYRKLNLEKELQSSNIGYGGEESLIYKMYAQLDSIASDEEVLYMAKNGNSVVKGYLSSTLVDRKSKYIVDLFSEYIKNDKVLDIQSGCVGYNSSIAGELYNYVFYQNKKIESVKYNKENYTSEELKQYDLESECKWTKPQVDSLLAVMNKISLSNENALPITLNRIFALNKFEFENYERIKYFAYKYPTSEILATLASFQNKKDLPFFHKNIDNSFLAISKFPDKSFIPELKERIKKCTSDYDYIDAVTAFCVPDSEELLNMVVASFENLRDEKKQLWFSDSELYDRFYKSLEAKNCRFNNDFLLKLWTNNRKISYSFFLKIKDKHYDELLKGYINPIPFDLASFDENMNWELYKKEWEENDGYLCPIILKYLKDNSSLKKDKSIDLDTIQCKG